MERLKEVLTWSKDWTGRHDPEAIERRRAYLGALDASVRGFLSHLVRVARKEFIDLAKTYADPICDEMRLTADVRVESDPAGLIALADEPGDDVILTQRRFEALCLCDFGIAMYELERLDPMDGVERDLRAMISLLGSRFFLRRTRELDVYTYHDDASGMYRVREVAYDDPRPRPGLIERRHNSRCRVATGEIPVFFDVRAKDAFHTVMKIVNQLRKGKSDPLVAKDRRGLLLVARDMDEVRWIARELEAILTEAGAVVREDGNNLTTETGTAADIGNRHSSKLFKVLKLSVQWDARWYEFQIVLFSGYYGSRYALDDENHSIYKLGQVLESAFPILYPGSIYLEEGTWESPDLRELLYERRRDCLGWAPQRKHAGHKGH